MSPILIPLLNSDPLDLLRYINQHSGNDDEWATGVLVI